MQEKSTASAGARFDTLVNLMNRLRAPGGCPWDREQTFDTIKKYTLEETYEVLDAIDRRDWDGLREELGDFLLQAVFYAQMASEEGRFSVNDSLDAINEKLVRRHPHIFAEETARTGEEVLRRWDEIKAAEKKQKAEKLKTDKPQGMLDGIPRAMPALVEAQQISSRAAGAGFDWDTAEQVLDKLREELDELAAAREAQAADAIEDEIGDLFFTLVNLARFVKVDPEQALRRTNAKFRRRFGHVERRLGQQGKEVKGTPIAELEALWQEAKAL
jgi:MazG family protein